MKVDLTADEIASLFAAAGLLLSEGMVQDPHLQSACKKLLALRPSMSQADRESIVKSNKELVELNKQPAGVSPQPPP